MRLSAVAGDLRRAGILLRRERHQWRSEMVKARRVMHSAQQMLKRLSYHRAAAESVASVIST